MLGEYYTYAEVRLSYWMKGLCGTIERYATL